MLLIFIAWLAHVALAWWAYYPLGRALSLAALAVASGPFLLGAAGLAGDATGDAKRLLLALLVTWSVPAGVVGWWHRR